MCAERSMRRSEVGLGISSEEALPGSMPDHIPMPTANAVTCLANNYVDRGCAGMRASYKG